MKENVFQNWAEQREMLVKKVSKMPPCQSQHTALHEFLESILFTYPDAVT